MEATEAKALIFEPNLLMIQRIHSAILVAVFLISGPYQAISKATHYSASSSQAIFHKVMLLFEQHQYAAAQKCFESYLNSDGKKYKQEEAAYYLVLSALDNKAPHVETLLQHFIVRYPKSVRIETVRYHLAKFFFEKGLSHKSLSLYQEISVERLAPKERAAFQYERSNNYLQLKDWANAKKGFTAIKDKKHPYYYPARLQMAYIAFEQGDYDSALTALQEASKNHLIDTRSLTLKVYHKAGAFESLLAYVKGCPASSFSKQDQLLIADAYFFLKQYPEAVIHYQAALDASTTDRTSLSKWGHALYEAGKYPKAAACFKQLLDKDDHASQMAAYYSGLIYEKESDTQAAIAAFAQAEQQKFDSEVRDLACIKRAALHYQQGAITEAIASMTTFIQENQESKNLSMAQVLLVQCYCKTKAYQLAIDYIAALPYKNEMLLKLYQKVLFYQGLAAYNEGTLDMAIKYLKQSLLFPFKPSLVLQAQFWLAEAFSTLEAYKKALKFYRKLMEQGSLNRLYHEKTLYGLAYAYFNTGNYTAAIQTFEQYSAITPKQPSAAHYDAILRLGDCYYVKKNYEQALKLYESVYTYHPAHVRYQEALIYEALGDSLRAERSLQEVITAHSATKYYEKALYHKACTLFNAGHYEVAIQKFSYLLQSAPTSDLQPELLIKRALAYENLQKNEAAVADYITILDQYPTHVNAENALMALSNLFTAQGTPEKIDSYLQKHAHIVQHIASHSDERTIDAARKLFYSQAYHKVLEQLTSFYKTYPHSQLLTEAYFLMAESYYRLQKTSQAISYYKKVVASSPTAFHKKAWLRMADLAYESNHFQEALTNYQKLQKTELSHKEYHQTLMGLIKASFALKQYQIMTPACLQLLNNPKEAPIEMIQQAALYLGKLAMQRAEYKRARGHLLKASRPLYTVTAAEAQYLLAHTEFKLKAYTFSLNVLFDLIEKFPHNQNYIDHAFLLMVDNYIILGNLTQAKATLDSIISQSKNKKNIELAKQKRVHVVSKLKKRTNS